MASESRRLTECSPSIQKARHTTSRRSLCVLCLALASVIIQVGGSTSSALLTGCPWEPLRAVGGGKYITITSNRTTTCAEHSNGACPFAVPFPDFPCLVNCVASAEACAAANRAMPAVNPFVDKNVCTSCHITACAECIYTQPGRSTCKRCFPGFIGVDGTDSDFGACALWDHNMILTIILSLFGFVTLIFLLIIAATCVTACKMTLTGLAREEGEDSPRNGLSSSLLDADQHMHRNSAAIHQGLTLSLMSSIKASSMRRAAVGPRNKSVFAKTMNVLRTIFDDRMQDLGLGLQLFFQAQIFLIVVSAIVYIAARLLEDKNLFAALGELGQCVGQTNVTATYTVGGERYYTHAKRMQIMCSSLWFVLTTVSLLFHILQKRFIEEYDKRTYSAEDYTLRIDGLPKRVTSERRLKRVLEGVFRCKIYGVSICYNLKTLDDPDEVEDLVDHIIEWDDLDHGWMTAELARPRDELQALLKHDKEKLEGWLLSGRVQSSGTAFVVFKTQKDLVRVHGEHRGISQEVFRKILNTGSTPAEPSPGANSEALSETVQISKDTCEPAGLRWYRMWTSQRDRTFKKFVTLPLRMIVYIAIYAIVAQVFFSSMIKPWQDNFIEGAESAASVKVTAKLVLMFNFAIQTKVMIDVEESEFVRVAQVDQITFVWNTVLLLVTNAYVFMQDCFREGVRWDLTPPDQEVDGMDAWWKWQRTSLQSARIEKEVGRSLVNTMTEQIMMLYVIGEVANVLLPVVCYYLAIRFTFLYHTERSKETVLGKFQKWLRAKLVRGHDREYITVREAERAQILVPLLLWMEYTYVVIFPAMAFVTFYLVTDENSVVCGWLLGFSIIFFIWQRYVMLWMYGKSTFDSQDSYDAFILMWGVVLSMLPPASIWWAWRLGEISEYPFVVLTMLLVYLLSLLTYVFGLRLIDLYRGARDDGIDTFGPEGDPGYAKVVEEHGMSWWNLNPVYVLKHRHCPKLERHEVQDDELDYWPKSHVLKGFFELGKEFKHSRRGGGVRDQQPTTSHAIRSPEQKRADLAPAFQTRSAATSGVRADAVPAVRQGPISMGQFVKTQATPAGSIAVAPLAERQVLPLQQARAVAGAPATTVGVIRRQPVPPPRQAAPGGAPLPVAKPPSPKSLAPGGRSPAVLAVPPTIVPASTTVTVKQSPPRPIVVKAGAPLTVPTPVVAKGASLSVPAVGTPTVATQGVVLQRPVMPGVTGVVPAVTALSPTVPFPLPPRGLPPQAKGVVSQMSQRAPR